MYTFSSNETPTLGELTSGAEQSESVQNEQVGTPTTPGGDNREERNQSFINGLKEAGDLTADIEGAQAATGWIRVIASWIVQVLSYAITAFLAVRVVLDLMYIGLPFTRGFLANGYAGNAQAGAGGMPNSMMGGGMGQPGMGMGMGGMGMGGMGMGGYGMRGGYGMNRGMGMGGMGMGGMGQGMAATGMNQQGNMIGRVQWVSNAALNAVAGESAVGPDGKANSPFKTYIHDMVLVLVLVPVLLILAATGALTNLGFLIGNLLCDAIASIGEMI